MEQILVRNSNLVAVSTERRRRLGFVGPPGVRCVVGEWQSIVYQCRVVCPSPDSVAAAVSPGRAVPGPSSPTSPGLPAVGRSSQATSPGPRPGMSSVMCVRDHPRASCRRRRRQPPPAGSPPSGLVAARKHRTASFRIPVSMVLTLSPGPGSPSSNPALPRPAARSRWTAGHRSTTHCHVRVISLPEAAIASCRSAARRCT